MKFTQLSILAIATAATSAFNFGSLFSENSVRTFDELTSFSKRAETAPVKKEAVKEIKPKKSSIFRKNSSKDAEIGKKITALKDGSGTPEERFTAVYDIVKPYLEPFIVKYKNNQKVQEGITKLRGILGSAQNLAVKADKVLESQQNKGTKL